MYDVVIIGGGPGGSTCGSFLKKYRPSLNVLILEREVFPRDHIGESQLPLISNILDEMGVWEKVEAANFPVKIGATYRWGNDSTLWDFHFLPNGEFHNEARPAKFDGQRRLTAFQVDRAIYDKILLDHARELGCEVREGTGVRSVDHEDDEIRSITLSSGEEIQAKYFVDATGHVGFLRRNLKIPVNEPSVLQNVAFWNYWTNAEWAVKIGIGGTRIQIMSLGYGWIWFIPMGPDRTSVGFVCPADYYKKSGMRPEELYQKALQDEPRIKGLLSKATAEDGFATTKDWSFVADRLAGKNWLLVGEAAGFADPILSAGLTLTHVGAREAAFTLIELLKPAEGRPRLDPTWLKKEYETLNKHRVFQHIRFADYWYSANGNFTELKEFTREIAKDAGLEFDADRAWQWLGTGGFADTEDGEAGIGGYSLGAVNDILVRLSKSEPSKEMPHSGASGFVLNIADAARCQSACYDAGSVTAVDTFKRGSKRLRLKGPCGWLALAFSRHQRVDEALKAISSMFPPGHADNAPGFWNLINNAMDGMVRDGWLVKQMIKSAPVFTIEYDVLNQYVSTNVDSQLPSEQRAATIGSELTN
jgi:flavin-dependent dehydrogenase